MIASVFKNHLRALHLAWLSTSGVQDYPADFKTLRYFPTAGQVVCCSKIILFENISLGFIPLTLPVTNYHYKKFLPTSDSSVRRFHHTRKSSHFNIFRMIFFKLLKCNVFYVSDSEKYFFPLKLLQTHTYTRETCDNIFSWYIHLPRRVRPGLPNELCAISFCQVLPTHKFLGLQTTLY